MLDLDAIEALLAKQGHYAWTHAEAFDLLRIARAVKAWGEAVAEYERADRAHLFGIAHHGDLAAATNKREAAWSALMNIASTLSTPEAR